MAVASIIVVGILGLAVLVYLDRREPPRSEPPAPDPEPWLRAATLRRVIVHTTEDRSFEGLIGLVSPDGLVLRAAKLLEGGRSTSLGGEIFIPRSQVLFVQGPP